MEDCLSPDEVAGLITASIFSAFLRGADHWAKLDVTMPRMKVLLLLGLRGSMPVSQLAMQMHVSLSSMCGILDRLQHIGWIERSADPEDRRITRISLADRGRRFLGDLQRAGLSGTRARLAEMTADNQRALRQGLCALMGATLPGPERPPSHEQLAAVL